MTANRLKHFLDEHQVKYVSIKHSPAYTAHEIVQSAHVHGRQFAKSVIVWLDGKLAMVVLPATQKVDLKLLKAATGAHEAALASEADFDDKFPGCEPGAMPPFGTLYGMKVFAASTLGDSDEIAFNAGSHTELFKMSYKDFESLVEPTIVKLSPVH